MPRRRRSASRLSRPPWPVLVLVLVLVGEAAVQVLAWEPGRERVVDPVSLL